MDIENSFIDDFQLVLKEARTGNGKFSAAATNILKCAFLHIASMENLFADIHEICTENGQDGFLIFWTNDQVDRYNDYIIKCISEMEGIPIYTSQAVYRVHSVIATDGSQSINRKRKMKFFDMTPASPDQIAYFHKHAKKTSARSITPKTLIICVGCRIMLTKNIDQFKGFVNGRRGSILEIISDKQVNIISAIKILFDPIQGNPNAASEVVLTWQAITSMQFPAGGWIHMYQFPIRVAYACTAHKAQGQTLDYVAICIDKKAFSHGAFYVALSRVRSLDQVTLFAESSWPKEGPEFTLNPYIRQVNETFLEGFIY
jgi:hypothetical protein